MKPIARGALLALLLAAGCRPKPHWTTIGTFLADSGELIVADPGYTLDDVKEGGSLAGRVKRAKKGLWTLSIIYEPPTGDDRRCAELLVKHESITTAKGLVKTRQKGLIGVDSGQAGVFDAVRFRDPNVVPKDQAWKDKPMDADDLWYSLCCERTVEPACAGVIPYGGVSSSGDGDGSYGWDVYRNKAGEAVAVRIVFMDEDDED